MYSEKKERKKLGIYSYIYYILLRIQETHSYIVTIKTSINNIMVIKKKKLNQGWDIFSFYGF